MGEAMSLVLFKVTIFTLDRVQHPFLLLMEAMATISLRNYHVSEAGGGALC
jgi:hypothetical protein